MSINTDFPFPIGSTVRFKHDVCLDPLAPPDEYSEGGFTVKAGQTATVVEDDTSEDWAVDIGPPHLPTPGGAPWVFSVDAGDLELVSEPSRRYIAKFDPQVWIRDNAVGVEPKGPQEWDCTVYLSELESRYPGTIMEILETNDGLDTDDVLQRDPKAPQWVQDWSGPFSIWVRERTAEDAGIPEETPPAPLPDKEVLRARIEDACGDFYLNDHAKDLIDSLVDSLIPFLSGVHSQ